MASYSVSDNEFNWNLNNNPKPDTEKNQNQEKDKAKEKDDTKAPIKLPDAGKKTIILSLIILTTLGGVSYKKYNEFSKVI